MPVGIFVPAQLNDLGVDVAVGSPAQGAVFYRGAAKWNSLAAGTSGQVLTSGGPAANPSWVTPFSGAHSALSGLTSGDDHTQYVFKTPAASTRNVIQPSGNFIAAVLRGNASQAVSIMEVQDSASTVLGSIAASGAAVVRPKDAVTAAVTIAQTLGHQSSGTPADGFGTELRIQAQSSTTIGRDVAGLTGLWATAADATRKGRGVLNVYDTAVREAMRFEADGAQALVGFGGTTFATAHVAICCAAANYFGLVLQGATSQTANLLETRDDTGSTTGRFRVLSTGVPSCPGAGTSSERFGSGSLGAGNNTVAIGNGASAAANQSTAIGQGATINSAATSAVAIGSGVSIGASGINAVGIGTGVTSSNSSSTAIGSSSQATTLLATAVGASSQSTNTSTTAVGGSALATGSNALAIGAGANASALLSTAVGTSSVGSGISAVALGQAASTAGFSSAVVIGTQAVATAANQLVVGSSGAPISTVFAGNGVTNASPAATTYNATGGSGADIAGANLILAGGKSTGAGAGGSIKFQSTIAAGSSSTLNTLQDKWVMTNTGVWQGWQRSSTADRQAFDITPTFATATDASRKARAVFNIWDTAVREAFRIEADGSNPMIGFLGANAAVRQTSGANLTNNVTSGGTDDTIANFTDLTTYANDAAAIRNDIYQLARKLKQVNDALRLYGLLT